MTEGRISELAFNLWAIYDADNGLIYTRLGKVYGMAGNGRVKLAVPSGVSEPGKSALERAQRGTLKILLELYIEHLRKKGKSSWHNAWNIFNRNVLLAFPALAETQAADVTRDPGEGARTR